MYIFLRLLACVGLASFISNARRGADVARVDSAKIDGLFAKWNRAGGPGLAVGVFVDGKSWHTAGYGMANLDEGIPVTPDSVFATFSLAKSFTTACVAILLDEGQITLDDDIRQHLPELPESAETIRIKHLLRCRSGLQDYVHAMMLSGREIDDVWTKEDVLDLMCPQRTMPFAAGASFNFSNSVYFLLGLIVERVPGKPLRKFADQRIFSPLGMHHTSFDDDHSRPLKNRVLGYARLADGSYHRIGMNSGTVGAIGLKTTVGELFKWDRNWMDLIDQSARPVRTERPSTISTGGDCCRFRFVRDAEKSGKEQNDVVLVQVGDAAQRNDASHNSVEPGKPDDLPDGQWNSSTAKAS